MKNHKIHKFPKSRIATIDICEIGKQKHHVCGMIELDVTKAREDIKLYNKGKQDKISFTAWLISEIAKTIKKHETSAAYLLGKTNVIIFDDVNISIAVEKELNGQKVPIPLVIEKANERSIESIALQISDAKNKKLTEKEIVLQKKASRIEKMYYLFPGFIRRLVWKYLLRHPKLAYKKMGNVAFTSLGTIGRVDGWFVPISVHPICFGMSSILKKPMVIKDQIEIREVLKMSILIDHDVIDGAEMARFISHLSKNIEEGFNK